MSRTSRCVLGGALIASALMIATTSTELGGLFARHQGHKIAQAYGMFMWAGVVLFIATAWRVRVEGAIPAAELGLAREVVDQVPPPSVPGPQPWLRGPHRGVAQLVRRDWNSSIPQS